MNIPRPRKKTVEEILVKIQCNNAKSIDDLRKIFVDEPSYTDPDVLNIGQEGELQAIYNSSLKPLVDQQKVSEEDAFNALRLACVEIPYPRYGDDFYQFLADCLEQEIYC